ncbi:MAG: polysaccharide pyruvyl transferase family protein [Phormidesmis sp.]
MRLTYYTGQNFGDALNPLIFEHFLNANVLNSSSDVELLGIGTIFGIKQSALKKVVFSSGVSDNESIYGPIPHIDERYDIRAVRGPLTAQALNLPPECAVTDGAALIKTVFPRSVESVPGRVGFIPHHKSLGFYDSWPAIADKAGLVFLDVRKDPEVFIQELWKCESVVTEAMHGAIVADTYGIPWIPIKLYSHISEFKWMDWASSVQVEMMFRTSKSRLHSPDFFANLMVQRGLPLFISKSLAPALLRWRIQKTVQWLRSVSDEEGYLSDRTHLNSLIDELLRRLKKLRMDYSPKDVSYH